MLVFRSRRIISCIRPYKILRENKDGVQDQNRSADCLLIDGDKSESPDQGNNCDATTDDLPSFGYSGSICQKLKCNFCVVFLLSLFQ